MLFTTKLEVRPSPVPVSYKVRLFSIPGVKAKHRKAPSFYAPHLKVPENCSSSPLLNPSSRLLDLHCLSWNLIIYYTAQFLFFILLYAFSILICFSFHSIFLYGPMLLLHCVLVHSSLYLKHFEMRCTNKPALPFPIKREKPGTIGSCWLTRPAFACSHLRCCFQFPMCWYLSRAKTTKSGRVTVNRLQQFSCFVQMSNSRRETMQAGFSHNHSSGVQKEAQIHKPSLTN